MEIRSEQFDDIYFSPEDGLAETQHVFLDGNNLPDAWKKLSDFTIVETGFGTGLNFLSTWELFEKTTTSNQTLDYISFEKHPLSSSQIKEALSLWSDKWGDKLDQLTVQYPLRVPGFHRIIFNNNVRLTIIFDDINDALPELVVPNGVNAWFLDGFAPSKNPEMWTDFVFAQMARLSVPNASLATFTVAGSVRRGLQEVGFNVKKTPGFGRKREMLRGVYQSDHKAPTLQKSFSKKIAIIGGGLAGSACAYVLKQRGFEPIIYEKEGLIAGNAPDKAIGLYNPRISAHKTIESDYYIAAFAQMVRTLELIGDVGLRKCGYIHMMTDDKKEGRFQETLENWGWHEDHMRYVSAKEASELSGIKLDKSALYLPDSGCVSFVKLHEAYLQDVDVRLNVCVNSLEDIEEDIVIIACYGAIEAGLGNMGWLPAGTVRGQGTLISATKATKSLKTGLCYGGHITPVINDVHSVGSTYQKWLKHTEVLEEDHEFNLDKLRNRVPSLAKESWNVVGGRAALRVATNDRFPVVGPVPDYDAWKRGAESNIDGLYVTTAHGSHGIISTMAAAHMLVDYISGGSYGLGLQIATLLRPDRFLKRDKRKNRL